MKADIKKEKQSTGTSTTCNSMLKTHPQGAYLCNKLK